MKIRFVDPSNPNGKSHLALPACLTAVKGTLDGSVYAIQLSQHANGVGSNQITNELAQARSILQIEMSQKEVKQLIDGLSQAMTASSVRNN